MTPTFFEAQPAFRVRDLDAALEFYQHLGFAPGYRNGTTHQLIHAGPLTIHLSTIEGGPGCCQIMMEGVDELFPRAENTSATILYGGLGDREWGLRDFTLKDPDGNIVTFAQRIKP